MWLALIGLATAALQASGSSGGSGGGGGGGAMGGGANAWSPSVGIAKALFGGGGSSDQVNDYGHMITDVSGPRNHHGDIYFAPRFEWPKVFAFALGVIGLVLIFRSK